MKTRTQDSQDKETGKEPASDMNTYGPVRTAFLRNFLAAAGIWEKDAAEVLGKSATTITNWFRPCIDDCPLSCAEQIINHYGYNLEIDYVKEPFSSQRKQVAQPGNLMAEITIRPTGLIGQSYRMRDDGDGEKQPRLSFVLNALTMYKISRVELGNSLNLNLSSINAMFRADDMNVSRIYEIANAYAFNVRISIYPAFDDTKDNWVQQRISVLRPLNHYRAKMEGKTDGRKGNLGRRKKNAEQD